MIAAVGLGVCLLGGIWLTSCFLGGALDAGRREPTAVVPHGPPKPTLDICMPTANEFLFQPAGEEKFFQSTVMGTWESGRYGCVRKGRDGPRFHEGVDIQSLRRDRKGEPIDPVVAVADGRVAFINPNPGSSTYGRYIILQHQWDGVQVHTLYAHLRAIENGLKQGQAVGKGQRIGTLGRSANTREGISRERAHVHFEINFMVNTHFKHWYVRNGPQLPDFGNYNGQNFIGIDPAAFLRELRANPLLNFAEYLRRQPEAFRVLVAARPFSWLQLHPECVEANVSEPAAYEIAMAYTGLPLRVVPRAAGDLSDSEKRFPMLRSVNEEELARNNCRYLVKQEKGKWVLTDKGLEWIELLTYVHASRG